MSVNVEETKDLVAIHNTSEKNLLKSIELGGLPSPSIAIMKAQQANGNSDYGNISLVFDKSTIDPQANQYNKVYGDDAWTPRYPTIEYKANENVETKISKLYYNFAKKYGYDEAKPISNLAHDLEYELNRHNGEAKLIEYYKDDTTLMNFYIMQSGKEKIQPVTKEIHTEMSDAEKEQSKYLINQLGEDVINEIKFNNGEPLLKRRKAYFAKYGDRIEEAYKQLMADKYGFSDENINNVISQTKMAEYSRMIDKAYDYLHGKIFTVKTETDSTATTEAIKKAAGSGYVKWLNDLLKGAEEKSEIRNNVDMFTSLGERRSFETLHWENTLENVVRAMRGEDSTGNAGFFGLGIWGVSAKKYDSIKEIKADKNRLSQIDEEKYQEIKNNFGERFDEIAFNIMDKTNDNQFIAIDNARTCIIDAIRDSKTKSDILKDLRQYVQLNVTKADVDDIVSLVTDISNMPTRYFEAKSQRAVYFNEVYTAIIPDNSSQKLKTALDDNSIKYIEYESDNEQDRLDKLNSLEDVRFSLDVDIDDFDESDYNNVKLSRAEYNKLYSEALTWDSNKIGQVCYKFLSDKHCYYVLDENYDIKIIKIFVDDEKGADYKNVDRIRRNFSGEYEISEYSNGNNKVSNVRFGNGRTTENNVQFNGEEVSRKRNSDGARFDENGNNDNLQEKGKNNDRRNSISVDVDDLQSSKAK